MAVVLGLLAESHYTGAPAGQQQCWPSLSTGGGAEASASVLLELKPTTETTPGGHGEFKTRLEFSS